MKNDPLYARFVQKWDEVTEVPPQTVGLLTPFYKRTVPYFKYAPWRIMVPFAFVTAVSIALLLEFTATQIASWLQKGV